MQPEVKPCRQSLYAEAFFCLYRFIISPGCLFWFLSQSCMLLVFVRTLCLISVSECILRLQMKYIVNWDIFNTKYIYYLPWNERFKICTMRSLSSCAMCSPNFCHLSLKCRMFVSCCLRLVFAVLGTNKLAGVSYSWALWLHMVTFFKLVSNWSKNC